MSSHNHVMLVGRLTDDARMFMTQSNRPKVVFRMAVPRPGGADFFSIVCIGRRFVPSRERLKKGTLVALSGQLQSRDVSRGRTATEVRALTLVIGAGSTYVEEGEGEEGETG